MSRKRRIQEGLIKKKECETRAVAIVERLLSNCQDKEWIRDAVSSFLHISNIYFDAFFQMKFISSAHYDDIVTERAIEKLCGYPLCSEKKGEEIKQQFKISTKTNRVYDLSDRKNFCSHKCLKHSIFLREQISQTPLWLRNGDEKPVTFYVERKMAEDQDIEKETSDQSIDPVLKKGAKSKRRQIQTNIDKIDLWVLVSESFQDWFTNKSIAIIKGEVQDNEDTVETSKIPLNEETNEALTKIEAFYKGSTELMKDLTVKEKNVDESFKFVPLVDKVSQITLQRRIMMENIERGFSAIVNFLPVSWPEVKPAIRKLVSSFKLTSSNIVIKQKAWTLICICLLCLLQSYASSPLKESQEFKDFTQNFLSELGINPIELETLKNKILKNKC